MKYKFLYKTAKGKTRNDITIEAPDRESAIASFESDFSRCKWYQTNEVPDDELSKYLSKCCEAQVRAEGVTTKYFVCTKCNKPTDIKIPLK